MTAPAVERLAERYIDGGEVFLFDEMSDTGALGDPSPATAAGGEDAWRAVIDGLAARFMFFAQQDGEMGRL
jgi:creatinine amidohydrolase/Fe(II)-dependent formamide hydrolase-like protein